MFAVASTPALGQELERHLEHDIAEREWALLARSRMNRLEQTWRSDVAALAEQRGREADDACADGAVAALRAACKGPEAGPESKSGRVGKEAREVAVLSAAQKMCASRGFPAGLLERVFRDLHAGDVLDETAMKAWRDDEASAIGLEKIAGKEKALFETMELLQEFASDDEGAEDAA